MALSGTEKLSGPSVIDCESRSSKLSFKEEFISAKSGNSGIIDWSKLSETELREMPVLLELKHKIELGGT